MLSSAAAQPPVASQGLLAGSDTLAAQLQGFGRSGSSSGLAQPPPTQLQLQQELLGGGPSAQSRDGSLANTPRTLSSGLSGALGGPAPQGAPDGGGKGWSSLDGIPRPNWQQLAPSDGILNSSQPYGGAGAGGPGSIGAGIQRPPSAGPAGGNPLLGQSFEGGLSRSGAATPNNMMGLPSHLQQQQLLQQRAPSQGLPNGFPGGQSPSAQQQQQLLQHQLAQQQQQQRAQQGLQGLQGLPHPGYQPQQQQSQANSLANLQAAAQAAQAAQQAAIRQQALRNALQSQQQPNLGGLSSQNAALLQHALLQQQQQAAGNALLQQQNALLQQQQQNALLNQANALSRAAQGLTAAQQNQLLQGQLNNLALQQQINLNQAAAAAAAAGIRPGALGGLGNAGGAGGLNPALAAALLGGGNAAAGLQALQQAQAQQNAQQQLLLNQALRANGLQAAGLGQRPPAQLQSEALIAMQRQQAALQAQGLRLPQAGAGGVAGTGLSTEQLLQLQQLGLLNKPAAPPPAAGGGAMTAQQQAALLNALQAGNQHKAVAAQLAGLQLPVQQQRPTGPPGLANGASYLSAQQQAQAQLRPPVGHGGQQLQLQQGANPNLLAALGGATRPPLPQQAQQLGGAARPPAGPGLPGLAAAGGRPGEGQSDPIQTLQDIGKTLAQLNITVEAAVNAGLLGGLSASDVKIVAEAHRAEMEGGRAGATTPGAQPGVPGASTAPIPIAPGGSLSAPGSVGAPTPPAPASPAHSHASISGSLPPGLPRGPGSLSGATGGARAGSEPASSTAGDDDFPLDVEEPAAKPAVDEAALKAKVEQMAAQFDASQYGFFGGAPTGDELSIELESEGPSAAAAGGEGDSQEAGSDGLPARPKSDPGAEGGEGEGYHLWGGAMLPDELDSKLTLSGGSDTGSGGRASAPPPAPGSAAAVGSPAGTAQQPADLASLWGSAQGDRSDPFGSYLAGLRLGTGF